VPELPPIVFTEEALRGMTAEQMSRGGICLRVKIQIPVGSETHYDLLMVPTKRVKEFAGRAQIVATYTEIEGICKLRARTQDDTINIDSLIALVKTREEAAKQGVFLWCTEVFEPDLVSDEVIKCRSS